MHSVVWSDLQYPRTLMHWGQEHKENDIIDGETWMEIRYQYCTSFRRDYIKVAAGGKGGIGKCQQGSSKPAAAS